MTWERIHGSEVQSSAVQQALITTITAPATLKRVLVNVSSEFIAPGASSDTLLAAATPVLFCGIQTIDPASGHSAADPASSGDIDVNPPTERWLWWDVRPIIPAGGFTGSAGQPYIISRPYQTGWTDDVHGQVAIKTAGQQLQVYLSLHLLNGPASVEYYWLGYAVAVLYE